MLAFIFLKGSWHALRTSYLYQVTQTIPQPPGMRRLHWEEGEIPGGLVEVCFSLTFCLLSETGSMYSLFTVMKRGLGSSAWEAPLVLEGWASPGTGKHISVHLGLALTRGEGWREPWSFGAILSVSAGYRRQGVEWAPFQGDCEVSGNSVFILYLRDSVVVVKLEVSVKITSNHMTWQFSDKYRLLNQTREFRPGFPPKFP